MRLLLDFLPIAIFFGAYKYYDIYVATAVLMATTLVQTGVIYAIDRKIATLQKATLAMILAFGSLTLWLHDERFIKWKPTALYLAFALGLAIAVWAFKKSFVKHLLGSQLELPDHAWMRLNVAWIAFFVFLAAVNAYVAVYFSTEAWVNFKLWGYVFWVAFLVGQGIYVWPHLKDDDDKAKQ
jgi:intracellular septation protein